MIKCYTGVPGAGKSLHSMRLIVAYLRAGKNVIANFPVKINDIKKNTGHFFYVPNKALSVPYLRTFCKMLHEENQENQTLLMIDEASVKFNCRNFNDKDRMPFLEFFPQHRKYGFEIVLISQNMRQIDRQIRDLIEIEVIHRKLNNFSLWAILPFPLFVAIERNNAIKAKNDHEFFLYSKKVGNLYDTFYDFTEPDRIRDLELVKSAVLASEIPLHTDDRPTLRERLHGTGKGTRKRGPAPGRADAPQADLTANVNALFEEDEDD